jgi:predicted N-acetyltransferase YhbS
MVALLCLLIGHKHFYMRTGYDPVYSARCLRCGRL